MDTSKKAIIEAPIEKVWEMVENPDVAVTQARGDIEVNKLGDGDYQLKIPLKLGLFKMPAKCNAKFLNKRQPNYSDIELTINLMGKTIEGAGSITLTEVDSTHTEVEVNFSGGSGGAMSKMIGGLSGKVDGVADTILDHMKSLSSS